MPNFGCFLTRLFHSKQNPYLVGPMSPLSHWQKSFATLEKICEFYWQRSFLALAKAVRLG